MSNNTQQNEQQDNNKVAKNYEATMKKLVAIVGGQENLIPNKKVPGSVVATVVEGLLKERKETTEKEVKTGLIELLDKHVAMKKLIEEKKKELKKLEEEKMKEFNEAANKLFGRIEGLNTLEQEYYESLNNLNNGTNETRAAE